LVDSIWRNASARPRFAGENGLFAPSPQELGPKAGSGTIENVDMAAS
jgi:hypothetical protein